MSDRQSRAAKGHVQMPGDISSTPVLATDRLEAAVHERRAGSPDASPVNILIVDDEPRNLTVLETILDNPSYRLVRAGSADDALIALLREDFALLILDIRMPGLSGLELAQIIKERKKTALVPIIFLTAYYNEDQHVLEGYGSGAVDYLHKPVNPAVLRSKAAIFAELYRKNREVELTNDALRAEVVERLRAEDQLRVLNVTLEQRIQDRTQDLRDSERHYRDMIDALPAAVYTTDAQGFLTHFNPASRELAGRTPALGKDQWCVSAKLYQPDAKPLAHEDTPMAQALRTGRAIREAELLLEQPDGKRFGVLAYSTPKIDATGAVIGGINILVDITSRKQAEDHIQMLMREVNHRAKNLLGLVQAVARQTAATAPQDFVERFSQRIQSMSANQDLLVKNEWKAVPIGDLIRSQMVHLCDLGTDRISLSGPAVEVTAAAAQSIGMVLHELATNAVKYGALSNDTGRVEISWNVHASAGEEPRFTISWIEKGGPPVVKPARRGFGSTMIDGMVKMNFGCDVAINYAPSGLEWRLACPIDRLIEGGGPVANRIAEAAEPKMRAKPGRLRVLVVEDEPLIAMEVASILSEAGFEVIGPASSVAQALALIGNPGCEFAVLDINLGTETAELIALQLRSSNTPFVTMSGYSREQQPVSMRDAPLLGKPLHPERLVAEIRRCLED